MKVEFHWISDKWVPDLIFPDETFNPLLQYETNSLSELLLNWTIEDDNQLQTLVSQVIQRYGSHQKELIRNLAVNDARLQFEMDLIAGNVGPENVEMLMTSDKSGIADKAIFVVGITNFDVGCLEPYLLNAWGSSKSILKNAMKGLSKKLFLKVTFHVHTNALPETSLQMPEQLETIIGKPKLPKFSSKSSILDYLQAVTDVLQSHCQHSVARAILRQQLLRELADTKLGEPIELDSMGSRSAMFQIMHDGVQHVVLIYMMSTFPEHQPMLTLQLAGPLPIERDASDYPWSPRWDPKEMAKRIYAFVKELLLKLIREQ